MKTYDVIVIGAGDAGAGVTFKALARELKVALIEKGNVGGTCINVGCVPSKTLLYPANIVMEIKAAARLGIHAEIRNIGFDSIMQRMKTAVTRSRTALTDALKDSENLDFYNGEGHFSEDYTLQLEHEGIKGKKIFIASGARPIIPPLKGLDMIEYMTSESILELQRKPQSICIIGGGYIGVEYGHFLAAMGIDVTILQKNTRLVPNEEPEISEVLQKEMAKRMKVITNAEVMEVRHYAQGCAVFLRDRTTAEGMEIKAEKIMLATGRKSNADLLKVGNTGVETDKAGFIKVDDFLRTGKKNIWALGDAIGKQMFTMLATERRNWLGTTPRKRKR